jgi:DNA-binding transcriptional regulator YiaG
MPNIASILKSEISRVARKEIKVETLVLKKAVAAQRKEIAALKRRTLSLEQTLRLASRGQAAASSITSDDGTPESGRFSAKGLRSQRRRLGISAAECGLLVGASAQSVYNWEQGKARPQARHLAAIAVLKTLGKNSAAAVIVSRTAVN